MQRLLTILVLLGALWPLSARAAFQIEPRLHLREEFTDNLFLDDRDEESDFITTINPGILLRYDARLLELELDYGLNFLKYLHHDEKDETSLSDTQRIQLSSVFLPGQDFSVTVLDEYQRVTIDSQRQVDEDSPFVNKSNRNRLVINPEYRSSYFRTFTPSAGYRYEKIDYDKAEGDDSDSHEVYLDLRKQLSSKVDLTLGGSQKFYRADRDQDTGLDEDYDRLDVTGRLDYRLSRALTLRAGGGRGWIDYKDQDNEQSLLWDLALDYQPGSRWRTGLAYKEDFSQSVNEGLTRSKRFEASFDYLERLPVSLLLYADKQDYQTEDREDRSVGGNFKLTIPFANRLVLDFISEASVWRFRPEDEDAFRYGAGLAASYPFKFGTLSAGYRYRASNSDVDENDYKSNVVYVQAALKF